MRSAFVRSFFYRDTRKIWSLADRLRQSLLDRQNVNPPAKTGGAVFLCGTELRKFRKVPRRYFCEHFKKLVGIFAGDFSAELAQAGIFSHFRIRDPQPDGRIFGLKKVQDLVLQTVESASRLCRNKKAPRRKRRASPALRWQFTSPI